MAFRLHARSWASGVHSAVLYRPPTWTGDWLYSNAFSCVNVILNENHQAVFAQSIFKRSLVKCLLPYLQFTRLWRNSKPLHSGSDTQSSGKKRSSSTLTKTVVSMFIISTNIYISTSCNIKRLWHDGAAWRDLEWGWQIRIHPLCTRRDFACKVWRRCGSSWNAILFDFKMHILPTGMYFTFM